MQNNLSNLPDPIRVSPLIKLCRYALLIAGIFYGASKQKALEIIESSRKEERERLKAEKDAKIAEERRAASERDVEEIIALFAPKPIPRFTVEEQSHQNTMINEESSSTSMPIISKEIMENVSTFDDSKDESVNDEECNIFSQNFDQSDTKQQKNVDSEAEDLGITLNNNECENTDQQDVFNNEK